MPDDYYVSQYSGEEIDALLGKAGSSVQVACNPNLLDNWYFGNPVNQRGQASYTGVGYTIDRWQTFVKGTVSLRDGYINLADTKDFGQQIELSRIDVKSPVTFSILTDTGLVWATHKFSGTVNDIWYTDLGNGVTLNMIYSWDGRTILVALQTGGANIRAVKLELGDHQTLAHKDASGNWVLNEIPDYGEQLRRCQRYFYRVYYTQYQTINMAYEDTAYAFLMLPLPVEMRIKNPVVTQSVPIALGASEKTLTGAEVSGCMARLAVNYDAIANPVRSCYAYCPHAEGVTFTLSADL